MLNRSWEIPVGHGRHFLGQSNPVVSGILGGWQVYWIGYLESGHYFSPSFSGSDPSNTNTSGGLPNRVCDGNLPSADRTLKRWFDPSCFAVPTAGNFGNSGAFVLEGPGYNMQDVSVAKTFHLSERFKLTFTTAATNILNHPNFNDPSANITQTASAGVVMTLVSDPGGRPTESRGRTDF